MIIRNIILGWRNIRKNGIYSMINIAGLSLGIAVVILILFWVVDELNYDKFHTNLDQIYTVYEHQQYSDGQELYTQCTPFPLSQNLKENFAEIENATTFTNVGNHLIRHEDTEYKEGPVISADNNFLDIFSFEVLEGNKDALAANDQIIITDELAHLFFGDQSAVGKVFKINNGNPFSVGAVIAKPEGNSTLDFKMIVPLSLLESYGADLSRWGNNWPNTCIQLAQGADAKMLNEKLIDVCKDNGQPNTTLHLFPYKDEHLFSYSGKNNRIQYIYQFLAIAFIIILIASINFINLSTAKADQRSPEVGVRKVLGAYRINLLRLFLFEKSIMIFLSLIASGVLVLLFLPAFRSISEKTIQFSLIQNKYMILMLGIVIVTLLIFSVAYPSLYLSSFNPVMALKRSLNNKKKTISLKSLLVVVQFILAITLISGSIIISQQIKYVNNYDLGYDHANLIYLSLDDREVKSKHEAIKQELSTLSGVIDITRSDKLPFYGGNSSWGHDWEGKDPENKVLICKMNVDKNYFKTLGIKFTDGNPFPEIYNKVLEQDENSTYQVILNKEAIRRMGMTNPIGKYFKAWNTYNGTIIGVTEDFHFESLRREVEPMLILPLFENPSFIIARIDPRNFTQTIDQIKTSWDKLVPQTACEIGFFDDRLERLYNAEIRISGLFKYFTFIAIFISSIGLFGLSLFIIERRKKEIGVRKVNGAKIGEVMILLNKNFVKWVIVSFVIATPIAWYVMHKWLENFAYKTTLSWWIFALAGLLALGIALLTVSWQSWRAATRNPVEALRYE